MSRVPESESTAADAPDEAVLLERARRGDADARDALVRMYLADVYRTVARVLPDPQLAEDATQDAFVNALNALDRFRGDASFRTWLLRIALNSARTVARRQWRRREVGLTLVEDHAAGPDTAEAIERHIDGGRVLELVDRLPPKQRLAVSMRIQQGLSYAEIATVLECTEGAARVNYHLGIKRLRELLA